MSEDRPDQWEREARELLNGHGNWRVDREQMIAKVAAALRERDAKWEANKAVGIQFHKELVAARAQLGALQHKFDVATTGPVMFPEEANRLRAQVQRLREALQWILAPRMGRQEANPTDRALADYWSSMAVAMQARAREALAATEEP